MYPKSNESVIAIAIDALWYQDQARGPIIATIQSANNTSSMLGRRRGRLEGNAVARSV